MKPFEKVPVRIKAADIASTAQSWLLPEVGSSHVIGIHAKNSEPEPDVIVQEEEIVAEKVTLAELESIRESAFEEGFESGKQEGYEFGQKEGEARGYQVGLERGEQEVKTLTEKLTSMLSSLEAPLWKRNDECAEWVATLAISIAESVLRTEVVSQKEVILASVKASLSELPDPEAEVRIRIHPDDQPAVASLTDLPDSRIRFVADSSVTLGGCFVESQNTRVDDSIERRFSDIVAQVNKRLAEYLSASDATPSDTHEG
jgi:flagellar assembly protein FliH